MAIWTLYVALEPYARRHWPHALISWTGVLSGRYKDPIVGRDVLFGITLGLLWTLLDRGMDFVAQSRGITPNFGDTAFLDGNRSALGAFVVHIPNSIQAALVLFFVLFVFRSLLRNTLAAAACFIAMFAGIQYFQLRAAVAVIETAESALIYAMIALVVVRFGFLALVVAVDFIDLLSSSTISVPLKYQTAGFAGTWRPCYTPKKQLVSVNVHARGMEGGKRSKRAPASFSLREL